MLLLAVPLPASGKKTQKDNASDRGLHPLTFAGTVQLLFPKQQSVALHSSGVELQAENDVTGGRAELLVIALDLVQEGTRNKQWLRGRAQHRSVDGVARDSCVQELTLEMPI